MVCAQTWPCTTARNDLSRAYADDQVGLAMLMGGQFLQATAQLPYLPTAELFDRFITWWYTPSTIGHATTEHAPCSPPTHHRTPPIEETR